MALSEHIVTAGQARLAAKELRNAAEQMAFALVLEGETENRMAVALVNTLDQVATDYDNWSDGKADDEEVFYSTGAIAKMDQLEAEIRDRSNPFN